MAGLAPGVVLRIDSYILRTLVCDLTGMLVSVTRGALNSTARTLLARRYSLRSLRTLWSSLKPNKRLQLLSMRLGGPPTETFADALVWSVPCR